MPCNCEPICVANRIRCDSPPLRLLEGRYSVRYVNPTSNKNCSLSLISFNTSFAIAFCLFSSINSIPSNQAARLSRFILLNSAIFLPFILNQRLSFFNLAPSQEVHGFKLINCCTHSLNASVL